MRCTVFGTGYLGATHAAGMAELGHEVIGVDVDPGKVAKLAAGEIPFYEPGPAKSAARQPRCGPAAVHHRLRRGGRLRRRALPRRRNAAEEGRVRRRPAPRARRDRHAGAAAEAVGGDRGQVDGAGGHRGRTGRAGPCAGAGGRRRRDRLESGVPPGGLRHPGHAAPRPHRAWRATGFDAGRGRDPRAVRAHPRRRACRSS